MLCRYLRQHVESARRTSPHATRYGASYDCAQCTCVELKLSLQRGRRAPALDFITTVPCHNRGGPCYSFRAVNPLDLFPNSSVFPSVPLILRDIVDDVDLYTPSLLLPS